MEAATRALVAWTGVVRKAAADGLPEDVLVHIAHMLAGRYNASVGVYAPAPLDLRSQKRLRDFGVEVDTSLHRGTRLRLRRVRGLWQVCEPTWGYLQ